MAGSNDTAAMPCAANSWRRGCKEREIAKARAARAEYRAGRYVIGSYHREATCEGCKQIFPMWRSGERMRCCSQQCNGRRLRVEREPRKPKAPTERRCVHCDSLFFGMGNAKYCTSDCIRLSRLTRHRARYVRRPIAVGRRNCVRCNRRFVGRLAGGPGNRGRIFCSERCNNRSHEA